MTLENMTVKHRFKIHYAFLEAKNTALSGKRAFQDRSDTLSNTWQDLCKI